MKVRILEVEDAETSKTSEQYPEGVDHSVFVESLDGTVLAKYQAKETVVSMVTNPKDAKKGMVKKEETISGMEAARRACKANGWNPVKR